MIIRVNEDTTFSDVINFVICDKPTPPYPWHIHSVGLIVGGLVGKPVAWRNISGLVLVVGKTTLVQIILIRAARVDSTTRRGIMHRSAL